jgi:hypothetical protein
MNDCRTGGRGVRAACRRAREKGQAEAKNKTKKCQLCLSLAGLLCRENGANLSKIVLILVLRAGSILYCIEYSYTTSATVNPAI